MEDWEIALIESVKSELLTWKNKHISKRNEVTSAARITVPAGFLQPISHKHGPLAVKQDEAVAPRRRRRLLLVEDSSDDDGDGSSSTPNSRITVPAGFLQPISKENGPLAVNHDEVVAPRSRRSLLLEVDDNKDDHDSKDLFTNYPKMQRSRKNRLARSRHPWPCYGDSNKLIIAEISGHALRKERESAVAAKVANGSSHNLGLRLEDFIASNTERTCKRMRYGANSEKENLESIERTCEITEFGETSDKENPESIEKGTCKRMRYGANSEKENLESIERTCKRRGLGETKVLPLASYKLLEMKLKEAEQENELLVNMIEEERRISEQKNERLRKELEDASYTIQELVQKIKILEGLR